MFDTPDPNEWLPPWLVRWKPFLISLVITPFALLLGIGIFSPEGPRDAFDVVFNFLSLFLFPVPVLVLIVGLVGNATGLFYLAVLLMLFQFPCYGFVMSLVNNRRRFVIIVGTIHTGIALLGLAIFLLSFGWRVLRGY
jgi:hypothetical protein